ncbi:hypothetical protein [Chitinophaga sp. sic0106]|uniref:hypothetical protein n=1 Tax=Chitinophaga sp. sic0106 TaxID=2854785 RepID=UPI001C44AFD0|nr:hypothetical protein [Chitinophaga sp. sic0106]MBV7534055.1 hypothetical protein [Chitinophaga sp. sic0106]
MKNKISVKDVFESADIYVIEGIEQGSDGQVRIKAKTRYYKVGAENQMTKWVSKSYATKLYGSPISNHPKFIF